MRSSKYWLRFCVFVKFSAWRNNPDRIVGVPGRTHKWNAATISWEYAFGRGPTSMVLTGYAFIYKVLPTRTQGFTKLILAVI